MSTPNSATEVIKQNKRTQTTVRSRVLSHLERLQTKGKELNAVVTIRAKDALKEAEQLDALSSEEKQQKPLFGLPITVKDQFMVRGTPTTMGCANRWLPLPFEGPLVSRLRDAGAVIIGKSSTPQLLVSHQCHHAGIGHAVNPFNKSRTTGGSSGGEAALVAAGIVPLGLAGDMGGSIRIPAHCCGVMGLKPTEGRFPLGDTPLLEGAMDNLAGFEGFQVQPGPIGRSVEDLKLFMDTLLSSPFDAVGEHPFIPWETNQLPQASTYKVGIVSQSGLLAPSPAIQRALEESKKALEKYGISVIPFKIPEPLHTIELYISLLGADGGAWLKKSLRGDKPTQDIQSYLRNAKLPALLRPLLSNILGLLGEQQMATLIRFGGKKSASQYWTLTHLRTLYRKRFIEAMDKANIDLLLTPPYSLAAPLINENQTGVGTVAALEASLCNLTGMPAGVVPVTRVRKSEEIRKETSKESIIKAAIHHERDSAGLPVGVQIIGRHWKERDVLSLMALLEEQHSLHKEYPLNTEAS